MNGLSTTVLCCYGKVFTFHVAMVNYDKKLCCHDQMFMLCCYGEMLTCSTAVVKIYTDIELCCHCKRLTLLLWQNVDSTVCCNSFVAM